MFSLGETGACHLVSIHNLSFQARLMSDMRANIQADTFPDFIRQFMYKYFKARHNKRGSFHSSLDYPEWVVNALRSVNVELL
jgi:queuine tRNA-ribosyltransferase catalytic subunit